MKPKTEIVMADIIRKIRTSFPFEMSEEEMCAVTCSHGCPKKLLEYMHEEISEWEQRLAQGDIPSLRDIDKLSKTARKIYKILQKNRLIDSNEKEQDKA